MSEKNKAEALKKISIAECKRPAKEGNNFEPTKGGNISRQDIAEGVLDGKVHTVVVRYDFKGIIHVGK